MLGVDGLAIGLGYGEAENGSELVLLMVMQSI